jgi:hypothetical protein
VGGVPIEVYNRNDASVCGRKYPGFPAEGLTLVPPTYDSMH